MREEIWHISNKAILQRALNGGNTLRTGNVFGTNKNAKHTKK
jgi:hypothetical protein